MEQSIQTLAESYLSTKSDTDFTTLYNRLIPGVRKYAWSYLKDYSTSSNDVLNEILSSTFAKVFTKLEQYNPIWNFSTWVYRIARNECLMEIERLKKLVFLSYYTTDEGECLDPLTIDGVIDREKYITTLGLEEQEEYSSKMAMYDRAIDEMNNLKDIHKDILIDRELNHMKYEDIAEKYRLPLNTVKSRIRCAREKVRTKISKFNEE